MQRLCNQNSQLYKVLKKVLKVKFDLKFGLGSVLKCTESKRRKGGGGSARAGGGGGGGLPVSVPTLPLPFPTFPFLLSPQFSRDQNLRSHATHSTILFLQSLL